MASGSVVSQQPSYLSHTRRMASQGSVPPPPIPTTRTSLLSPPLPRSTPPFRLTSLLLYFLLGSQLKEGKWNCFRRSMAIPLGVNFQGPCVDCVVLEVYTAAVRTELPAVKHTEAPANRLTSEGRANGRSDRPRRCAVTRFQLKLYLLCLFCGRS